VYHCRVPPALRIIRKSSFTPKPWKNGGGVTHEALRMPADGEAFACRVSVAHIDASGPFSDFAGYQRNMVLLKGEGLSLKFADGSERSLKRVGDLAQFDGALAPDCTLFAGPCVDLNLMVAKAHAAVAGVEWLAGSKGRNARAARAESTLMFGIDAALVVTIDATTLALEPWDLGVLSNGSAQVRLLDPRAAANPSAVFFATISH
jgi:environmental stress-induced protein Ves